MAGLKIAGCALTAAGLTTLLPASDAFVTKPDRAVCLQATFVIFVMLWAYEFAVRTLLDLCQNAHPVLERSRDRIVLARHSMDCLTLGYLALQGWNMWFALGQENIPATAHERLYTYIPAFEWCAVVMLGYQFKNLMDAVIHNDGPEFIVHHLITGSVAFCALGPYAHMPGIFFFGISETSTAVLTIVANFDDEHGVPAMKVHFPIFKLVSGAIFAVSFIALRTGVWPFLAYHFVQDSLAVLADGSAHSDGVVWGFIGCLGTLTLLQFAWLVQMLLVIYKEVGETMQQLKGGAKQS